MNINLRTVSALSFLSLAAYTGYAENVQISTYYPSPYGAYATLETATLQGVNGTGNIAIVPTAGAVTVGTATAPPGGVKLDVQGGLVRTSDAVAGQTAFMQGQAGGAFFGASGALPVNFGNSEGYSTLIADGGNVGIGVANPAAGTYKLDVAGTANIQGVISIRDANGDPGVLQVDCASSLCYPIYA